MAKVRFAPSPTGYLHIGGARTALFNWVYAKAVGAQFLLRIEDTDLQRSKKEYEEEILDSMKWLGLDWDELQYQSQRFDLYQEYAQKLLDEGKAYKDGDAVLFKIPKKEIKLYDLIRGEITFDTANFFIRNEDGSPVLGEDGMPILKDEVLIKADGSPAYSFCCVVDDALMGITCVIRGEDHISNTPKQMMMYEALGFKIPKYAHLPLIMDQTGGRLSKRTGAVAVTDYRKQGFLSEALVNYLMLLGWAPGNDQEIFKLTSAIKKFSIKKVNKTAAAFSMDKLRWVNSQYIKQMSTGQITELLTPLLDEKGYLNDSFVDKKLENIVILYQGRLTTLNDFLEWADFMFVDELTIDEDAREKYLAQDKTKEFYVLSGKLEKIDSFDHLIVEEEFKKAADEAGIKPADLVHPVRVALTGKAVGPGLFEIMSLLGKEKTVKRLKQAFV